MKLLERHLGLACAVHVEYAQCGLLYAAGLGRYDAVDCVLYHALYAVGAAGARGVGNEHLLALSRGYYAAHGGYADGEWEMHGDCAVHLALFYHLLHLLVAFLIVCHMYCGYAFMLQRAYVIYVYAPGRCHDRSLHGVLFAVLAAHAGKGYSGLNAEAAAFQAFRHFHKGLGDYLFLHAHGFTPFTLLRLRGERLQTPSWTWRSSS